MATKVNWLKKLNRVHYKKGSKRPARPRIADESLAIGIHRRNVARYLQSTYDRDDSESDLVGSMVANQTTDIHSAFHALAKRPLAWTAPEPIEGQMEQEYVELAHELVDAIASSPKVGRTLKTYLIDNGRLPSRRELASESNCGETEARNTIDLIESVVLRIFTLSYLDEKRAERVEHCAKRTTYSEDKILANLFTEALPIEDNPAPLNEPDLAHLERELVDNLLAYDCPERLELIPIVAALVRGDSDALAIAIERLPQFTTSAVCYRPSEFSGRYSPFPHRGECILKERLKREKRDREEIAAQKRAEDSHQARIEARTGTIAQQYKARYDRAVWELYA